MSTSFFMSVTFLEQQWYLRGFNIKVSLSLKSVALFKVGKQKYVMTFEFVLHRSALSSFTEHGDKKEVFVHMTCTVILYSMW